MAAGRKSVSTFLRLWPLCVHDDNCVKPTYVTFNETLFDVEVVETLGQLQKMCSE